MARDEPSRPWNSTSSGAPASSPCQSTSMKSPSGVAQRSRRNAGAAPSKRRLNKAGQIVCTLPPGSQRGARKSSIAISVGAPRATLPGAARESVGRRHRQCSVEGASERPALRPPCPGWRGARPGASPAPSSGRRWSRRPRRSCSPSGRARRGSARSRCARRSSATRARRTRSGSASIVPLPKIASNVARIAAGADQPRRRPGARRRSRRRRTRRPSGARCRRAASPRRTRLDVVGRRGRRWRAAWVRGSCEHLRLTFRALELYEGSAPRRHPWSTPPPTGPSAAPTCRACWPRRARRSCGIRHAVRADQPASVRSGVAYQPGPRPGGRHPAGGVCQRLARRQQVRCGAEPAADLAHQHRAQPRDRQPAPQPDPAADPGSARLRRRRRQRGRRRVRHRGRRARRARSIC